MSVPNESPWFALYTMPRAEKKLAERLKAKGFDVYAPTQIVLKQWSDRKKKVEEPFFRSYVFIRFSENEKTRVLETPGAAALVTWLGKPAQIPAEEMSAIRSFLDQYQEVTLENASYAAGQRLRITDGELEDAYGTVVREKKHRIVLEIEKLGMVLYAEVPKSQVENP